LHHVVTLAEFELEVKIHFDIKNVVTLAELELD
jgi:hypothetical protein